MMMIGLVSGMMIRCRSSRFCCLLATVFLAGCGASALPEIPKALPPAPPGAVAAADGPATSPDRPAPVAHHPIQPNPTEAYVNKGLRDSGMGTGFFVRSDGSLLTNNHVVSTCEAVSIETTDGKESLATVVSYDAGHDLALLKADTAAPAVARFRAKVRLDGRHGVLVGYPSRGLPRIRPTLLSAALTGPVSPDGTHFSLKADVRPGNSGGPVLDDSALVVGVVFGKINSVLVYQNTGKTIDDVGFAISNDIVLAFLTQHGIATTVTDDAIPKTDDVLFDEGRQFVVRVLCWKRSDRPVR